MKRQFKICDIPVAKPRDSFFWNGKHPSIEDTGRGDLLCYETWGARLFLSSEDAVRAAVKSFIEEYQQACRNSEEDPAHVYVEVFNFNDLYDKLHILPSTFGDKWGYESDEDHAVHLKFSIYILHPDDHAIASRFGRDVLIIEPADDDSYPDYCNREY